ncbi:hypothetical protein SAMN06265222_103157 [Neorhodopirellula lusitana]|uniref:4Fe-4S ferredoxin-type domain-containing protein n=1 Tax=Neorhodopirellula lusitana TaxID=445327 RepID=A0ABY1PZP8_9BACT|nr:hypothetical protein [Neorhodopirellula lusitana]SMP50710.1 hypothetical protein SAMN06265222_103157 [Neorhodopirellula lusitana]
MNTCPRLPPQWWSQLSGHRSWASWQRLGAGQGRARRRGLSFACSLCGSCTDVCPVKVLLHYQSLAWRNVLVGKWLVAWSKRVGMKAASMLFQYPRLSVSAGDFGRVSLQDLPRAVTHNRLIAWAVERNLPESLRQSFRAWFAGIEGDSQLLLR